MKWFAIVLFMCFTSSVIAQAPVYNVQITQEIDGDGACINWVDVPDTGITWVMDDSDSTVRVLLLKKPAPFPLIDKAIITLVVDTPPDIIPSGYDGAWWKMRVDLTKAGITAPDNASFKVYGWARYSYSSGGIDVDPAEAAAFIIEKRQAGKAVVVPG